jgi:signal transduction histidine kinase
MRFRTWPVAALGLAGLLVLIVMSLLAASRRAQSIYTQLDQLNEHHRIVEGKLRRLRSDVHLSGIHVRDYLLDHDPARTPAYRERLKEFRRDNLRSFSELLVLARQRPGDNQRIAGLQARLEEYWQSMNPVFDWTPAEKATLSAEFLRLEVLPRREALLTLTRQIEELNDANLAEQRAEMAQRHQDLRNDLETVLWQSVLLGLIVAVSAVIRLRVLERRSEQQRTFAEDAEHRMRQLSQQLVATQEEERRKLSRELHDHVGQTLTGLRMELGRIERLRMPDNERFAAAVGEARSLVDDVVRTVRDLALGLRPSMLDDFGLQAALEWHVRDLTRRSDLAVALDISGDFADLSDQQKTCIYRVVQEALTNCVRHAKARRVTVGLSRTPAGLELHIADDGIGIEAGHSGQGLGLKGIEERVRELSGTMRIDTAAETGTTLHVALPLAARPEEASFARAAG